MAGTLQFVDKIDASPSVRLDLSDGVKWWPDEGVDFSPPPLKRSVVSTLLRDGEEIPASAYENRVITLPLKVKATTKDLLATELQTLNRELDRPRNILKWQAPNATNPVFFRTFRSPDYRLEIGRETNFYLVELKIVAEPFAYGLKVTQAAATINNDPAAGTNPQILDVTGVTGDVPTPLYASWVGSTSAGHIQLLAVRRHGTPANGVRFFQAEAMTQGTDTTTGADATASGGSRSRCTFATVQAFDTRLSATFPRATPNSDDRGTYRVFGRFKNTLAGDDIRVRTRHGADSGAILGDTVKLPLSAEWRISDLGLFTTPSNPVPELDGYSNVAAAFQPRTFILEAQRVSGSGSLDIDYLLFVPADEELSLWENSDGIATIRYDGPQDMIYPSTAFGISEKRVGNIPLLAPNQTNRLHVLRQVESVDAITDTVTVTVSFWPRHHYVRP